MLSFFPKPYPDEIFYSILSRYQIRSGNTSTKVTSQELFNSTTAIATIDLPCNLKTFADNLSLISEITVNELIQNHTLYPFYAPFLPSMRSRQVIKAMKSEHGGSIHDKVGVRASSIKVPKFFRFCPHCIADNQEQYGELYWHRLHQVPGVLICPTHGLDLQDSSVPIQGFNRHEYCAASVDNCVIKDSGSEFSDKTRQVLRLLAQDVQFLLTHKLPAKDLNWFSKHYIVQLIDRGLATATGRVHQRELLGQFLYYYGHSTLEALDSAIAPDDTHTWLSSIVRKHRKVFHPIRHLLMIQFLGVPVAEFFKGSSPRDSNADRGYQPFGAGQWLCLNPAAEHYLKPVVTNLAISICHDTKKPVGTFSCSCGFIYCRTGPDQTEEDTRRIGKIKAVGPVWEQKLEQLVEVEQLGLRETARRLRVDSNTINRYVRILKLSPKWRSQNTVQKTDAADLPNAQPNDFATTRTQHRQRWSALQNEHVQTSKTELRRLSPATYIWLYRNDREWLNQSSPPLQKPVYLNNRVNWQERDQKVLAQVKEAVKGLLTAEKPLRVSVSRVGKAIGKLALIEQHLDQMPITKAYLNSVIESIEDFQIRRIKWAAKQIDRQGEALEYWKVIRMAGLRPGYSKKVETALEQLMLFKQG